MKKLITLMVILLTVNITSAQNYDLDTSLTNYGTPPPLNKPNYLQTVIDPLFGTKITRISGDVGSTIPNTGGETWRNVARHGYSSRQPWNADESIIYLNKNRTEGGSWGASLFLDGETYQPIKKANIASANEQRWHPTDPDVFLLLRDDGIHAWSYANGTTTQIFNLSGYSSLSLGFTGNWSFDGNVLAVMATRNSDGKSVIFAMNSSNGYKSPDIDVSGIGMDYVTTSPLGNYIVANGYFSGNDTTRIYDAITGAQVGATWTKYGRPSHYDVMVENGVEYVVGNSKSSPDEGRIIKRRLSDGQVTVLTTGGYGSHATGRAVGRTGWVFSPMSDSPSWGPYYNEILGVSLTGNRVERIVSIRSSYSVYENQTQPCVSPSGNRIMYASDWDSGSTPIQAYVVDFRDKTTLSVGGPDPLAEVRPYPNPTNDKIFFDKEYDAIKIYDLSGRVVNNTNDLSNLSVGLYIVSLQINDNWHNFKVFKR
jgi:hypothetical protein